MLEIEIENFQSIVKSSFQIDRFTGIVGRSNIGKSALVRAIQCALTGAVGTDFVRHGKTCERRAKKAKKCRCQSTVTIKTDTICIIWEKGDDINQYRITREGEEERKLNALDRGEPEFLKPEFEQVQIGDSRELIQIADQFEPIFLLNKTGGVVADVISDVAKLDDLNEATRLVNKDRKEAAATRTVRDRDLLRLTNELDAYAGLDAQAVLAQKLEDKWKDIQASQVRVSTIERYLEELKGLKVSLETLQGIDKVVVPSCEGLTLKETSLKEVVKYRDSFETKSASVDALNGVQDVVIPAYELTSKFKSVELLTSWVSKILSIKSVMTRFQGLDTHVLPTVPAYTSYGTVVAWHNKQEGITQEIDRLTAAHQEAVEKEQAILQEYADLGICPTCTQNVTPNHSVHS